MALQRLSVQVSFLQFLSQDPSSTGRVVGRAATQWEVVPGKTPWMGSSELQPDSEAEYSITPSIVLKLNTCYVLEYINTNICQYLASFFLPMQHDYAVSPLFLLPVYSAAQSQFMRESPAATLGISV